MEVIHASDETSADHLRVQELLDPSPEGKRLATITMLCHLVLMIKLAMVIAAKWIMTCANMSFTKVMATYGVSVLLHSVSSRLTSTGTGYREEERATYKGHKNNPSTNEQGYNNKYTKMSNVKRGYSEIPGKHYTSKFWDKNKFTKYGEQY